MRLSVDVDAKLVEEVRKIAGVRTKKEAIDIALREMVRSHRLRELIALEGSGIIDMDVDELLQWRAVSDK